MPLGRHQHDFLGSLEAALSELHVRTPEGKAKEKATREGGAEDDCEGKHVRTDDVSTSERPSEIAQGVTEHPTASSPTATTLPATHPATSSPTTTPRAAEGTGISGMPYPTHAVEALATEPPMAPSVSEPVASGSFYVGIHEPAPCLEPGAYHRAPVGVCPLPMPSYIMPLPGFASLSGLRGPESCGGRSRGSRRSSNRSVTYSEMKEALRGAAGELVADLIQEIRDKLKPLIPPRGSLVPIGASPHRVQANHLVAGLTHTLGGLRSRPMPTRAAVARSPFIPRTAQPPYSHVENSTSAELNRAMVDVELYGCRVLGGDPLDNERPSLSAASPSEDNDPEDPDNASDEKKKKKRKSRRHERRRSKEAKAIVILKIVVNVPEFTRKDLSEFAESFDRFLRMTGQTHASGRVKCDLLLQCCKVKYLEKQVKQIVTTTATFANVLVALERQYSSFETDLSIRTKIRNLAMLPNNLKVARISELLADLDLWVGRLTPQSYGSDELLFSLVAKITGDMWDECRATAERKARTLTYEDLSVPVLELALEKESDQHLNAYRPG